jgi:hypothetical protein
VASCVTSRPKNTSARLPNWRPPSTSRPYRWRFANAIPGYTARSTEN